MCSQYFEIYCGSENVNLAKIFCFAQKDNTIVAIHVVHTCTSAKWIMDGMAVQHTGNMVYAPNLAQCPILS